MKEVLAKGSLCKRIILHRWDPQEGLQKELLALDLIILALLLLVDHPSFQLYPFKPLNPLRLHFPSSNTRHPPHMANHQ